MSKEKELRPQLGHSIKVKTNGAPDEAAYGGDVLLEIDGKEFEANSFKLQLTKDTKGLALATVTFLVSDLEVDVNASTSVEDLLYTKSSVRNLKLVKKRETASSPIWACNIKPTISAPIFEELEELEVDQFVSQNINELVIEAKGGEQVTAELKCSPFKRRLGAITSTGFIRQEDFTIPEDENYVLITKTVIPPLDA